MCFKKKVFISHRRNDGQASTDAILVSECLKRYSSADIFMDVAEEYLGSFPKTLKEKIQKSDAFALVIPKSSDYGYLADPENWVHKEIHYALTYNDASNKPSRIVPVVFDRNFQFPPKEQLGDIAEIADFNFLYFDTNNSEAAHRLVSALGLSRKSIIKTAALAITAILIFIAVVVSLFNCLHVEPSRYRFEKSNELVTELDRFDTFNEFSDSCDVYVKNYIDWYLETLSEGKDLEKNAEFNDVYIKEYCIRYIVMIYWALTNDDLDKSISKEVLDEYINSCYSQIPQEAKYPISLQSIDSETRTRDFNTIIDSTLATLESDPRLQSMPESMLQVLKDKLISKLWTY